MNAAAGLRLLAVVDGFNMGGAERALLGLLERLGREGNHLAVFSTGHEGPLVGAFTAAAHRVVSSPKRWAFDVALVGKLVRMVREEQPDVVLSQLFYADVIAGLAQRQTGVPTVSWQHIPPSGDRRNNRFYHHWAYRLAHPRFARIVACAECVRQDLIAMYGIAPERILTIHNGVDLDRFRFCPPRGDPNTFCIGMVARFWPEKGHACLLRALPLVRQHVPQAEVVLVGTGPTLPQMRALADELGVAESVIFAGNRQDMEQVYPMFDVATLPSDLEAHPITVLEAMACGRPVVGTAIPGMDEAIIHNKTGLLVPQGNSAALAATLVDLAQDRARLAALGRAARADVEQRFDLRRQQEALIALLRDTANAHPRC